ncbi:hypothetical protein E2562_036960 [Oryza meyeriana var. granulata]|uniref:Uncharacterized protein n=1 Tax=Oryza meyeriana var. granulata TaxID=110450 RepID=A0A6G1ETJ2_9ORYZ|nr:hypothetical protein E2562_036960 [Oryza meyeriana var. granulata]
MGREPYRSDGLASPITLPGRRPHAGYANCGGDGVGRVGRRTPGDRYGARGAPGGTRTPRTTKKLLEARVELARKDHERQLAEVQQERLVVDEVRMATEEDQIVVEVMIRAAEDSTAALRAQV